MATIKRSKTSASIKKKKTVIPEEIFETKARKLNREATKLISRKSSYFRYFVAFAITINDRTIFKNDIVEVDKVIKSIDDIKTIEEKITSGLKVSLANSYPLAITGEIGSVQIINFKRI